MNRELMLEYRVKELEELLNVRDSTISYLEGQVEELTIMNDTKNAELDEYKDALKNIILHAFGEEWNTHQQKMIARHHIIRSLRQRDREKDAKIASLEEKLAKQIVVVDKFKSVAPGEFQQALASVGEATPPTTSYRPVTPTTTPPTSAPFPQAPVSGPPARLEFEDVAKMRLDTEKGIITDAPEGQGEDAPPPKSDNPTEKVKAPAPAPQSEKRVPKLASSTKPRSSLSDLQEEIILAMGDTGEFEVQKIKELLISYGKATPNIYKAFDDLRKTSVLEIIEEQFRYMGRGAPCQVNVLTSVGEKYFREIVAKRGGEDRLPVPSKYYEYLKEAKSPEHGAFIQTVRTSLNEAGYETFTEQSNPSEFGESICDILAFKNGKEYPIEIECGNYSEADFLHKIKKILASSSKVLFVCKSGSVRDRILNYTKSLLIDKYGIGMTIGKFRHQHDGMVSIITFEEFKNRVNWPEDIL